MKIGDAITEINGIKVAQIIKNNLKYLPASNYPTQLRDLSKIVLRTNEEFLSLKIERNGITQSIIAKAFNLNNIVYKQKNAENYLQIIQKNIAYFYMGSIQSNDLEKVMKSIANTKGLVIDLRNYPSDFVVYKLGKLLKPKTTEFVKFSMTNQEFPGLFTFTSPTKISGTSDFYKGKIAVLINETTLHPMPKFLVLRP